MAVAKIFTEEQAKEIGNKLGVDWSKTNFSEFCIGLEIEMEHGLHDTSQILQAMNPILMGQIALAHLNEFPDYYTRLS